MDCDNCEKEAVTHTCQTCDDKSEDSIEFFLKRSKECSQWKADYDAMKTERDAVERACNHLKLRRDLWKAEAMKLKDALREAQADLNCQKAGFNLGIVENGIRLIDEALSNFDKFIEETK